MAPLATNNVGSELPTYTARNSTSSSDPVTITPPLSPPEYAGPSSRIMPPRAPTAAHFAPFTMNASNIQPFPTLMRNPQAPNPYSEVSYASQQSSLRRSSEWGTQNTAFDISSNLGSPISPTFEPIQYPHPGAQGEESLFDRWLRHEDLARPIFPGSKTGSSIATSDISSVREGMFGSLPSGSVTSDVKRNGPGGPTGPGSVFSAGTRDRDNFSSSTPSYPSSRAGGSRPSSRWGGEGTALSVDGESFTASAPSSPGMHHVDLSSRLRCPHPAPPPAPTPPTSSTTSSIPSSSSSVIDGEDLHGVRMPESPEAAATRPPRYSATIRNTIDLTELINRGMVGYQGAMPLQYPSEKGEKKAEMLGGTGTVMLVQEDVWLEMKRLAALAQQQQSGQNNQMVGEGSSWDNLDLEKGFGRTSVMERQKRNRRKAKGTGCCGACVIS